MIPALPLDTVSINPGSVDAWLEVVAWVTVATILGVLWVLRSYLRYRATDAEARRHLRELRPQLLRGTSVRVRIRQGFEDVEALDRLRTGFERDEALEEDDATIRDVAGGLSEAARGSRPPWVPVLAWRGILEGVLLLVVGLVAFAPLAYWRAAVDPSPPVSPSDGLGAVETGLELATAGLGAFPFADLLFGLVVSTGIIGLRVLWGAWLLPAALLVLGGLVLTYYHVTIPEDLSDHRLIPSRTRIAARSVGWLLAVWFTGVAIAYPFRVVGGTVGTVGEVLGLGAALVLSALVLSEWVESLNARIWKIAYEDGLRWRQIAPYLILRRIYLGMSVGAALLLVGYVGHAIVSGRLLEVLGVIASAPAWVLVILGLGAVALVVIVGLQLPGVVEDVRDLGSRVSRSTVLRVWVFSRGVPIVGTVGTFAVVLAMFTSILAAGGAALLVGIVLRVVGSVIVRAKYAALRRYSGLSTPVKEVHVSPFTVEDADGSEIWVADVDGTRLAHRDRESLLDDVLELVRERTETGEAVSTESEHYYRRVEDGYVDLERLRTKLRTETRLEARVLVRDSGGEVDREAAREELARDYPETVVDAEISELRRRGILDRRHGRLVLRD